MNATSWGGPVSVLSAPGGGTASARRGALRLQKANTTLGLIIVGCVALAAVGFRLCELGATYESSDQAAMPYLVRHSFGIKWMFAHDYGLVPAVLHRVWAEAVYGLGVPLADAAHRLPVALLGLAQMVLTVPLLRRLGSSRGEAILGAACCAVLPALAIDARYSWGYLTLWLFTGTLALWGTLAYLQDRRGWQVGVSAAALLTHVLSNCYSFALPATIGLVWFRDLTRPLRGRMGEPRTRLKRFGPVLVGYVLPCGAAVGVLLASWWWTGAGPLGHLARKRELQPGGLQPAQFMRLPALWIAQFGFFMAAWSGFGLLAASRRLWQLEGKAVLAVWAWLCVLPLTLLTDWSRIGYAGAYFIEAVYCGGLLAVLAMSAFYDRAAGAGRAVLAGIITISLAQMAWGTLDDCLNGDRHHRLHGVVSGGWGAVRPDSGIKAAGCYVRQVVPLESTVLCLHTRNGMELPVAELYCGRRVLACYDLRERDLPGLLRGMRSQVDVIIADAAQEPLLANSGLEKMCTLRREGVPVRYVYGRAELPLARVDQEISALNACYDLAFQPRRVPLPLPEASDFAHRRQVYYQVIARIREARLTQHLSSAAMSESVR